MSLSYLGIRNDLTKMLDGYVREDEKYDKSHVYIMSHDGEPDTFEDSDTYGWFIRYPGYTCGNVIFDKKTNLVVDFFVTERGGNFAIQGLGTVFKIPSLELRNLVLKRFKGKPLTYDITKEN